MSNNNEFRVFISFGGAGGKCLVSLAELVAQDHAMGRVADRLYSFVLVDTDLRMMKESEEKIRSALGRYVLNSEDLMIETLALGDAFGNGFPTVVMDAFHDAKPPKGLDRLKDAWWMSKGMPFTGRGLMDASTGAGQMPVVSRFMAWKSIDKVDEITERISNGIKLRAGASNYQVKLFMVSSLAGGTGRGCWTTLALKFKERFRQNGIPHEMMGIFLDATCFHYADTNPEEKRMLRLNSLTGISELVMWHRNAAYVGQKENYVVPSLDRPEVDQLDCIDLKRSVGGEAAYKQGSFAHGPTVTSFLVFGSNRYIAPEKVETFQALIGGALYTAIRSPAFASSLSNETEKPIKSLGSAVAQVPSSDLLSYFRLQAQAAVCGAPVDLSSQEEMVKSLTKKVQSVISKEEIEKAVKEKVKAAGTVYAEFLAAIGRSEKNVKGKQSKTTAEAKALEIGSGPFAKLEAHLKSFFVDKRKGDPSWTKAGIASRRTKEEENAEKDFEALAILVVSRASAALVEFINSGQVAGTAAGGVVVLNLAGVESFLQNMVAWLKEQSELVERSQPAKADEGDRSKGKKPLTLQETTIKLGGWAAISFGVYYDEDEQKTLEKLAGDIVDARCVASLAPVIRTAYKQAADRLSSVLLALKPLSAVYSTRANRFGEEANLDPRGKCFINLGSQTEPKYAKLLDDAHYSPEAVVQRILKFPVTDEQLKDYEAKLLTTIRSGDEKYRELNSDALKYQADALKVVLDELVSEVVVPGVRSDEVHEVSRRKVRKLLDQSIEKIAVDEDFVRKNFDLSKWLSIVRTNWINAIRKSKDPLQSKLREAFLKQFGSDVKGLDSNIPDEEEMYYNFIAAFSQTCQPMMRWYEGGRLGADGVWISGDQLALRSVIVAAPNLGYEPKTFEANVLKSNALKEFAGKPSILNITAETADLKSGGGYNPFSVVVMSWASVPNIQESVNLGGVASLEYWKDPDLKNLLDAAEEPTPEKNIATGGSPLHVKGGVGYLDPRFVRNSWWRRLRWKPWASSENESMVLDEEATVMAYVILGNFPAGELDPADRDLIERAKRIVARLESEVKFRLPLCERQPDNSWVWKRRISLDGVICAWTAGETAAKSLSKLIETVHHMNGNTQANIRSEAVHFRAELAKLELASHDRKALRDAARLNVQMLINLDAKRNYRGYEESVKEMVAFLEQVYTCTAELLAE